MHRNQCNTSVKQSYVWRTFCKRALNSISSSFPKGIRPARPFHLSVPEIQKTIKKRKFCCWVFCDSRMIVHDLPKFQPFQKYFPVHATSDLFPQPRTFWTVLMGTVVLSDIGQNQKVRLPMVRMLLKTAYHMGEVFKEPKTSLVESSLLTLGPQKLPSAPSKVIKIRALMSTN